ncbi:MAG: transglutaminase-like cysteine peptidase [Magnetococcales bacterium]|nr:transglutaminase-like cysteine peptidase [Magnetococcales bacterium]
MWMVLWVGVGGLAQAQDAVVPMASVFQRVAEGQDHSGRYGKLTRALAEHARHQPPVWEADLAEVRHQPVPDRLQAVQERVNQRILPREDPENVWLAPVDSYRQGGDCEDYALAKMLLLRESGFPEAELRLVTLAPTAPGGVHHVVLLARVQEKIHVLDSPQRTPGSRVVALGAYRDAGRSVVWSGWSGGASGGVSGNRVVGAPGVAGRMLSYRQFPANEKLARIAADWLIIHPWEPRLTPGEVERLRLLREYYHEPTPEHAQRLTPFEVRKLEELRRLRKAL